jgi:hypothetical protein
MQEELEVELQSLFEMVDKKQKIRNAERYKILTIISAIFVTIQTFVSMSRQICFLTLLISLKWIKLRNFG